MQTPEAESERLKDLMDKKKSTKGLQGGEAGKGQRDKGSSIGQTNLSKSRQGSKRKNKTGKLNQKVSK